MAGRENGVFNFEGGCYAKVIKLSREAEPEIYATTERFGTVLENVVMDPETRELDLDDDRHTENTRAAYPIDFIPNACDTGTRRTSEERHHADGGCVRRAAADRQAHAVAGDVSFPLGLHGESGGHGKGPRQGTAADLLHLFRRALHAAASGRIRQSAARADRPASGRLLAGEHGLDGRRLRRAASACRSR